MRRSFTKRKVEDYPGDHKNHGKHSDCGKGFHSCNPSLLAFHGAIATIFGEARSVHGYADKNGCDENH